MAQHRLGSCSAHLAQGTRHRDAPTPRLLAWFAPPPARPLLPCARAVFKLARSQKRDKRQALLHFLEHTADHGEPNALEMRESKGAELCAPPLPVACACACSLP